MKIAEAIDSAFSFIRTVSYLPVSSHSFKTSFYPESSSDVAHFTNKFERPSGSSSSGPAVSRRWYKKLPDFQHTPAISTGSCLLCRWQITHLRDRETPWRNLGQQTSVENLFAPTIPTLCVYFVANFFTRSTKCFHLAESE